MTAVERLRRLRWSCRRGMKELDVLLTRFVDANEGDLANGAWPTLEQLLACEDDVLWARLQASPPAADSESELLRAIRSAHAPRA